jgi:Protein kinase domain
MSRKNLCCYTYVARLWCSVGKVKGMGRDLVAERVSESSRTAQVSRMMNRRPISWRAFRPLLRCGRVAGAPPRHSTDDLVSAFERLAVKSKSKSKPSKGKEDECPNYAAVRETKDGRSYVLQRVAVGKKGRTSSAIRRKYCRERKGAELSGTDGGDHSAAAMRQGEHILEATFDPRSEDEREDLDRARHRFRSNKIRHVYLGVSNDDLNCWEHRPADFRYGSQIGRGSFGSVHEACRDTNCQFVLKISFFSDDFDREVAEREIAVMRQMNNTGLIAKLLKWKICSDRAMMLMEKLNMSAEQLGKQQYEQFFGKEAAVIKGSMLFTDRQIQAMFDLAVKLSALGISHGDLKLDNIMYLTDQDRFVIIDFGFTGTYREFDGKFWSGRWGFTHAMGCDQQKTVPKHLVQSANVWQLITDLGTYPIVLIAVETPDPDPGKRRVEEIRLLVGLGPRFAKILSRENLRAIQKECPDPRGELYQQRKEFSKLRDVILRQINGYWL